MSMSFFPNSRPSTSVGIHFVHFTPFIIWHLLCHFFTYVHDHWYLVQVFLLYSSPLLSHSFLLFSYFNLLIQVYFYSSVYFWHPDHLTLSGYFLSYHLPLLSLFLPISYSHFVWMMHTFSIVFDHLFSSSSSHYHIPLSSSVIGYFVE